MNPYLRKTINQIFEDLGFLEGWSCGLSAKDGDLHSLAHDSLVSLKESLHKIFDDETELEAINQRLSEVELIGEVMVSLKDGDKFEFHKPEVSSKTREQYEWNGVLKDQVIKSREEGLSYNDIGKKIGRSASAVRSMHKKILRERKISAPPYRSGYEEEAATRVAKIRTLAGLGWVDRKIAKVLGHCTAYVSQIRNANGIIAGSQAAVTTMGEG